MTTNLAFDQDTLKRFLDMCSRISVPVWVYTSAESTGQKMEYVRDGIDWDLWHSNLDMVLNSGVVANTGICGTLSAISADGFVDFLYWLLERKKTAPANSNGTTSLMLSVNPVRFPSFQNIVVLPNEMRQKYSKDIQEFLNIDNLNKWFLPIEIDHIDRFAKYLSTVEIPHQEKQIQHGSAVYDQKDPAQDTKLLEKDFRSFFDQYDQRRGKNFINTFPNLAEWYQSIK
jgi:hypothetical protein